MLIVSLSPFSFLVFVSYCTLLFAQCCFDSLELVWIFIELLTFVFVGLALTSHTGSFITYGVVSYFITQSILSMVLLVSIFLSHSASLLFMSSVVFLVTVSANLGVFPFSGWYQSSVSFFPTFILIIALTLHKLPLLYMAYTWIPSFFTPPAWVFLHFLLVLNLTTMSLSSISSVDLRTLLITTSMGNNSWLLLACIAGGWILFLFLLVYSVLLALCFSRNLGVSSMSLLGISGLPPSPLFFSKVVIMWAVCSQSPYEISLAWLVLIMFTTLPLSYSYLRFAFSRFVTVY